MSVHPEFRPSDAAQSRAVSQRLERGAAQIASVPADYARLALRPTPALPQVVLADREIDAFREIAVSLHGEFSFHLTMSGDEALALLRDGAADVIVVGQKLYNSTGIDVLAAARDIAPHTERILLADAAEAADSAHRFSTATPLRVMLRPCTPDKLRALLHTAASVQTKLRGKAAGAGQAASAHGQAPRQTAAEAFKRPDASVEHVVLETAPTNPRASVPQKAAGAKAAPWPIVVFTTDEGFYRDVRIALGNRYDLMLAEQLERVVELAKSNLCPILITDRAATSTDLQHICSAVRAIDPALVVIAAGPLQTAQDLRSLVGADGLQSFLPKPLSAPLVRMAVESARRQLEPPSSQVAASNGIGVPLDLRSARPDASPHQPHLERRYDRRNRRGSRLAIGLAALALLTIAGWQSWRTYWPAQTQPALTRYLAAAQTAFDAGRYAEPADVSALHYYQLALKLDAANRDAQAGVSRTTDRLIELVERALIDDRVEDASAMLTTLYRAQPHDRRLPFLDSQLDKARRYRNALRSLENLRADADSTRRATQAPASTPLPPTPAVLESVAPIYPETALKAGVEGWVDVAFNIQPDGAVVDVVPLASYPPGPYAAQFELAASEAMRRYRFQASEGGNANARRLTVRVVFKR